MAKKEVYLIGISEVEGYEVKHVCSSIITAKIRWQEVKDELLEFYQKSDKTFWDNQIEKLNKMTFDNFVDHIDLHDNPTWRIHELET